MIASPKHRNVALGLVLLTASFPQMVFAQDFTTIDTGLVSIADWVNRLGGFLVLLATLYFFWGLTNFVRHAESEEAQSEAKQIMVWGVVAVFVMVSFWGLVSFLIETFALPNVSMQETPGVAELPS